MPVWGRRGSYVAVTYTAVALVAVALVANLARPLIPPPEPNLLAGYRARFLARAAKQEVSWRIANAECFAEAKRLDRPVLFFAGSSISHAARRMDAAVFNNREVAARLNRDFVCVRVDTDLEPEWRMAFLPMLRNSLADNGYAIYFFSPDGMLLTWLGRRAWIDEPDFNDFLGGLSEVVELWRNLPEGQKTQAQQEQDAERSALRAGGSLAVPDVDGYLASLVVPRLFWHWDAGRYRALWQAGRTDDMVSLLGADLCSPRSDLVDGGFFRIASGQDGRLVEFDKSAVDCAEMLPLLAIAFRQTNEPVFQYWYDRTVESLKTQFMVGTPWSSHLETDLEPDGRSPRHSFGTAVQRTHFDEDLRKAATDLGLVPRDNPLMVPYLLGAKIKINPLVEKLQKIGNAEAVVPSKDDWLDTSGFVVARLYEAAAILQDDESVQLANQWAVRLREFRAGRDEVRHSTQGRGVARRWLGDYTAFADAMFEAYCATGDEASLQEGEAVLRRALELFAREAPGDFVAGLSNETGVPLDMPSLVDDGSPPATVWLMTLCFRYGCVLGDPALRRIAVDIAARFSPVANDSLSEGTVHPAVFASFFAAAQEVMLNGCEVTKERSPAALSARRTFVASTRNAEITQGSVRYLRDRMTD